MSKIDWSKLSGSHIALAIFVSTLPIGVITLGLITILGVKSAAKSEHAKCVAAVVQAGSTAQSASEACAR